jgi:hypothetical protein
MSTDNKHSVLDKHYKWPDTTMANGSGDSTRSSQLIAFSLRILGDIIHDFAKMMEQKLTEQQTDNQRTKE